MANTTISALPSATTPLSGTEVVPIVQSGVTKKVAASYIGNVAAGSNTQIQYNSSNVLAGSANLAFDGAQLGVNGITVGRGAGAVATNTAVGASALNNASTTGTYNIGIGPSTGVAITSAEDNIGIGGFALTASTTGGDNIGIGVSALRANTTGANNVGIGTQALRLNTTASFNTALGYQAGYTNTTGAGFVAAGYRAAYTATGNNYVAIGNQAMGSATTGDSVIAIGTNALNSNSGSYHTAVGHQALYSNTTASYNTAVGYQAGYSNTTGDSLSAFGPAASLSNTTGVSNSSFGRGALYANTTGSYNTGIGQQALQGNTTASTNTAVGYQAGYYNTTGYEHVLLGYQTGFSSTTSRAITAVGLQAGYSVTTAQYGTFIGRNAGLNVTTGGGNNFFGVNGNSAEGAGHYVTTGSKNTILGGYNGNQGGLDIRTASNYIVLSDGDGNPRGIFDGSGNLLVGKTALSDTSVGFQTTSGGRVACGMASGDAYILYSTAASAYRFYVTNAGVINATSTTITAISDVRLKENIRDLDDGLNAVMALKPRKFDWKAGKGKDKKDDRGWIAQEFEQVFPDMIDTWKDPAPEGEEPYKAINADLIPTLVKAIQEQQALILSLKARLDAANL